MTTTLERGQQPGGNYVGASLRKLNGDLFVTGSADFINDIIPPGTLYTAILRSPCAHAHIRSIDTSTAASARGVVRVLTGAEIKQLCNPIPHWVDPKFFGGQSTDVYPLAINKVVYAGQPVAAVVATSANDAEAALGFIQVEYEELPVVLDAEEALQPDAPILYEGWNSNLVVRIPFIGGDTASAFAGADHVIKDTIKIQRYNAAPIEPRGYLAHYDKRTRNLTFYGSIQNPHPLRLVLSIALRMPENRIRIIAPHVGGAFGSKMHGYPEEALVCILSMLTGAPVKWVESRRENLIVGAREQTHHFEVAFNADGRVLAIRDHIIANVGALEAMVGWPMTYLTALTMPCGYKIEHGEFVFSVVATNKAPWNAARGYGKEATNLVMERIMDLVAQRLGMDPARVRMRNFVQPQDFPYTTVPGLILDSGNYQAALQKALDLIDYQGLRSLQAQLRREGRYIGIGIAYELTPEGGAVPSTMIGGYDSTTVRVDPSGTVSILTGVTTPGGGNDTAIAQVVADILGIEISAIQVTQGDTEICPYGHGNYSGRSMIVGGSSAALAAREVREKMAKLAAALLECSAEDVVFENSKIYPKGSPGRALHFADVTLAGYNRAYDVGSVVEPTLASTRVYRPPHIRHIPDEHGRINPYPSYSNGAYIALVEVDIETGCTRVCKMAVVHDCGVIINPVFVEGQTQGAVAMGIGAALSEEVVYDEKGRPLTTSLRDYLMPRAADVPEILIGHQETPCPYTLLGTKGAGEAGVGGTQAAVVNAVADALAPFGVELHRLPLNPPNVLRMLNEARQRGAS
jgi:carbon-monoxide dehydrogenase large subunit